MSLDFKACTDGELAALTLAGHDAAYAEIMARHRDVIYRLIRGHIGDADQALDLVQECFVAAFLALDRFQLERPFRPWISRIAINKCRDWKRRRIVRRVFEFAVPLSDIVANVVPDPTPAIDVAAADRQELAQLWRAVAMLPSNLKEPLILHTIEGLSQAEVADVLSISEKAVETRIYRARAKLASVLASS